MYILKIQINVLKNVLLPLTVLVDIRNIVIRMVFVKLVQKIAIFVLMPIHVMNA